LFEEEGVAHIHAHWASTPSTVAMIASTYSRIPWSFTAHRGDIVANNLLEQKIKHATFARFISNSGIKLAGGLCDVKEANTHVLHMGVNVPAESKTKKPITKKFVILCPANLIEVKGHKYLIEALSNIRKGTQVELLLAGEGKLRGVIESQVNELSLSSMVTFLGQLLHEELLMMYASSKVDAVVLPSVDLGEGEHEGIPVSLMEAMAYGVPVLSTLTGGIPELLGDGAGVLVEASSAKALTKALDELILKDAKYLTTGEKGRVKVNGDFNQKKVARVLIGWFERGLKK